MPKENEEYIYKVPNKGLFLAHQIQDRISDISDINQINCTVNILLKNKDLSKDEKDCFAFIYRLTDSYIDMEGKNFIYKPVCSFGNGSRSVIPEDLSEEELDLIDSLIDDIKNPFLKARMADIIWYRKQGDKKNCVKRARQYVDIYFEMEIDGDTFIGHEKEFRRAISIAKSIKCDYAEISKFKNKLIPEISKCKYGDVGIPFRIFDIVEIAPESKDYENILTAVTAKIANAKPEEKYWSTDIGYLELHKI